MLVIVYHLLNKKNASMSQTNGLYENLCISFSHVFEPYMNH